jgi:hypothetical protein
MFISDVRALAGCEGVSEETRKNVLLGTKKLIDIALGDYKDTPKGLLTEWLLTIGAEVFQEKTTLLPSDQ